MIRFWLAAGGTAKSYILYNRMAIPVSVQYGSHVWLKSLIERTLLSQRDLALHAPNFYLLDCAYPGKIHSCFSGEAVYGTRDRVAPVVRVTREAGS